jgi:hypothetical protein
MALLDSQEIGAVETPNDRGLVDTRDRLNGTRSPTAPMWVK